MEGKRRGGDVCVFVCMRGGGVGCKPKRNLCAKEEGKMLDVMAERADALANGEKWKEEKLAFA